MAKAKIEDYFDFSIEDLIEGQERPFPVYIFLPENNHIIMISKKGESRVEDSLRKYISEKTKKLYCPLELKSTFDN